MRPSGGGFGRFIHGTAVDSYTILPVRAMSSSVKMSIAVLVLAAVAAFFLWPSGRRVSRKELRAMLDQKVDHVWMASPNQTQDAVRFFESGGVYIDLDPQDSEKIDRDVILPLLKDLKKKYDAQATVVCTKENPGYARGLFVRLPEDSASHRRMQADIEAADERFAGAILTRFGDKWLAIDALNKDEFETLFHEDQKASGTDSSSGSR